MCIIMCHSEWGYILLLQDCVIFLRLKIFSACNVNLPNCRNGMNWTNHGQDSKYFTMSSAKINVLNRWNCWIISLFFVRISHESHIIINGLKMLQTYLRFCYIYILKLQYYWLCRTLPHILLVSARYCNYNPLCL